MGGGAAHWARVAARRAAVAGGPLPGLQAGAAVLAGGGRAVVWQVATRLQTPAQGFTSLHRTQAGLQRIGITITVTFVDLGGRFNVINK